MTKSNQVTKEYLEVMRERTEYFKSKNITELTDEEIKEFINLRKEFKDIFSDISKAVEEAFELVKETPEYQAQLRYQERVLNRSESNE